MATHELKCWPEAFDAVAAGEKGFEWRKDDRASPFAVGDILVLQKFIPCDRCGASGREPDGSGGFDACGCLETKHPKGRLTGRELHVRVTWVLRDRFGVPPGYVVMSIRKLRSHR